VFYFFFFQAEDGIRDFHVTGVQTCALPISSKSGSVLLYSPPIPRSCVGRIRGPQNFLASPSWTESGSWPLSPFGLCKDFSKAIQIGRASCREECRSRLAQEQKKWHIPI